MSRKSGGSIDQAVRNLAKWVQSDPYWSEMLDGVFYEHTSIAAEALEVPQEEVVELLDSELGTELFGAAFEDLLGKRYEVDPDNAVDAYLKRRGWRETPPGRRYLHGLRDATLSVYEVVAVEPGRWIDVQDLFLGGDPVRVSEVSMSRQVVQWDRFAARVLTVAEGHVFSGVVFPLDPKAANRLVEMLEKIGREAADDPGTQVLEPDDLKRQVLRASAPLMTSVWILMSMGSLRQPPPEMVNFDDEPVRFCDVRFPITGDASDEIAERMQNLAGWEPGGNEGEWVWKASGQTEERSAGIDGLRAEGLGGTSTYGFLRIGDGTLILSTNSLERAERGKSELGKALAGLVGTGLTEVRSVEQMLAENPLEEIGGDADEAPEIPPEVEARVVHQVLDRHYRRWPDEPIPALGGITPRQAAADPESRSQLIELLKELERSEERLSRQKGIPAYDFGWLWTELGVGRGS